MSYAIQSVLLAVPAIGFTSLAIDLSWMQVINDQLQNAADSAALAAVTRLAHPAEVVPTAVLFGDLHEAGNQPVVLDPANVEVGTFAANTFTPDPSGRFVRVVATAQSPTILARVFGLEAFGSTRTSIATMRDQTACGIVGLTSLDLSGSVHADSFDSTLGDYATTKGAQAGVCSNQTPVDVGGNTLVEGNVLAGVGGTVNVRGSATVTGIKGTLLEPLSGPTVVVPGTSLSLPSPILSPIVLPPGNYFLLGNLDVHGSGSITVTGETHVYVDGDVSINGNGVVNTSQDPHNFSLEVIGPHTVHYNGTSDFFGALVAPQSDVTLNGTADVFGTVVGATVRLIGNLEIHVDQSLVEFLPAGGHAALVL